MWENANSGGRYTARKTQLGLKTRSISVSRGTLSRLIRGLGIHSAQGAPEPPRTTVPGDPAGMPQDLLERGFYGTAPNRRWVADITYVPVVAADFVYTAFVMNLSPPANSAGGSQSPLGGSSPPCSAENGHLAAAS